MSQFFKAINYVIYKSRVSDENLEPKLKCLVSGKYTPDLKNIFMKNKV